MTLWAVIVITRPPKTDHVIPPFFPDAISLYLLLMALVRYLANHVRHHYEFKELYNVLFIGKVLDEVFANSIQIKS